MKSIFLFLFLLSANALGGSVYVGQHVNLKTKKVKLSFLANITSPVTIIDCSLWDKKELIKKYELNLKLHPTTSPQSVEREVDLPANLNAISHLERVNLKCNPEVKETGWIIESSSVTNLMPQSWKMKEGVLKIPKGKYQINETLNIKASRIEFSEGVELIGAHEHALQLEGEFTQISGLDLKMRVELRSSKSIEIVNSKVSGKGSLLAHAEKIHLKNSTINNSLSEVAIELYGKEVGVHSSTFSGNKIGLIIQSSDAIIHSNRFDYNSLWGLNILYGKSVISNNIFEKNKDHLKCDNKCQSEIKENQFSDGGYGVWASNESLVKSFKNRFTKTAVSFGAYKTEIWSKGSQINDVGSLFSEVKIKSDHDKNSEVNL